MLWVDSLVPNSPHNESIFSLSQYLMINLLLSLPAPSHSSLFYMHISTLRLSKTCNMQVPTPCLPKSYYFPLNLFYPRWFYQCFETSYIHPFRNSDLTFLVGTARRVSLSLASTSTLSTSFFFRLHVSQQHCLTTGCNDVHPTRKLESTCLNCFPDLLCPLCWNVWKHSRFVQWCAHI